MRGMRLLKRAKMTLRPTFFTKKFCLKNFVYMFVSVLFIKMAPLTLKSLSLIMFTPNYMLNTNHKLTFSSNYWTIKNIVFEILKF